MKAHWSRRPPPPDPPALHPPLAPYTRLLLRRARLHPSSLTIDSMHSSSVSVPLQLLDRRGSISRQSSHGDCRSKTSARHVPAHASLAPRRLPRSSAHFDELRHDGARMTRWSRRNSCCAAPSTNDI